MYTYDFLVLGMLFSQTVLMHLHSQCVARARVFVQERSVTYANVAVRLKPFVFEKDINNTLEAV